MDNIINVDFRRQTGVLKWSDDVLLEELCSEYLVGAFAMESDEGVTQTFAFFEDAGDLNLYQRGDSLITAGRWGWVCSTYVGAMEHITIGHRNEEFRSLAVNMAEWLLSQGGKRWQVSVGDAVRVRYDEED